MPALLRELSADVRYAARTLRLSPGFTALALVTLAIGIGANTAIFSVIDATLLRPLPFAQAERLMRTSLRMPRQGATIDMTWSYPKFLAFRTEQSVFQTSALYIHQSVTMGGDQGSERVPGESVSAEYFDVLGVRPTYGTLPVWTDDGAAPSPAAVLGHAYWRTRYAADPRVVGSAVLVDGRSMTIAAVLPPGFRGLTGRADVFLPIPVMRAQSMGSPGAHQFEMVARLRPGATAERAKEETRALGARLAERYPTSGVPWGAAAYTLEEVRVDPALRQAVLVTGGAVGLLLLIACVNLAGLLVARGTARRREMAIRMALGAPRSRLVRQMLAESVLLAALGAAAGMAVAWGGVRALIAIAPVGTGDFAGAFADDVSGLTTIGLRAIRLDGTALAFTAGVSLVAGMLFGLLPALRSSRADLGTGLRARDVPERAYAGLRQLTTRSLLAAVEVALAVVLLVGSGLVLRSLDKLLGVDTGIDPERVLTARISMSGARYGPETSVALWSELLERVAALPGVEQVGVATCAPASTECEGTGIELGTGDAVPVGLHGASPDYFQSLGIPLLAGRTFTAADVRGSPRVLIVNRAAAQAYWPGANPVGRRVIFWEDSAEIVGVVGDVRYDRLEEQPRPAVYLPFAQRPFSSAILFLREGGDRGALAAALRREVRRLDPGHALYDVHPMSERLHAATARTRFSALVLGVFAGIALLLAAVGVYGVMALSVAQRTREIGIRIALGAQPRRVVGMLVGQGVLLALVGGAAGLALAAAGTRVLGGLLYGVGVLDPVTHRTIALLIIAVAVLATLAPALRAARIDPVEAIRAP